MKSIPSYEVKDSYFIYELYSLIWVCSKLVMLMNCFLDTVFEHPYMAITMLLKREGTNSKKKSKPPFSCMRVLTLKIPSAGLGGGAQRSSASPTLAKDLSLVPALKSSSSQLAVTRLLASVPPVLSCARPTYKHNHTHTLKNLLQERLSWAYTFIISNY